MNKAEPINSEVKELNKSLKLIVKLLQSEKKRLKNEKKKNRSDYYYNLFKLVCLFLPIIRMYYDAAIKRLSKVIASLPIQCKTVMVLAIIMSSILAIWISIRIILFCSDVVKDT